MVLAALALLLLASLALAHCIDLHGRRASVCGRLRGWAAMASRPVRPLAVEVVLDERHQLAHSVVGAHVELHMVSQLTRATGLQRRDLHVIGNRLRPVLLKLLHELQPLAHAVLEGLAGRRLPVERQDMLQHAPRAVAAASW
eukprot:9989638-Alexandrium_andersonii.AAC.1